MLQMLTLSNVFGFRTFSLALRPLTVLVGPNNGGKTSLLRAIDLVISAIETSSLRIKKDLPNHVRTWADQCAAWEQQQQRVSTKPAPKPRFQPPIWTVDLKQSLTKSDLGDIGRLVYGSQQASDSWIELEFCQPIPLQVKLVITTQIEQARIEVRYREQRYDTASPEQAFEMLQAVSSISSELVFPTDAILPSEVVMTWSQLAEHLQRGSAKTIWRNRIHWLFEGTDPALFSEMNRELRRYKGGVKLRPPRRTKDQTQRLVMEYLEDENVFDLSAAGSGVRNLASILAHLCLSKAPLLMLDEPDSHLHSANQRILASSLVAYASSNRQILATTHAPDLIEELPLDSLMLIDRRNPKGEPCDDVGAALVAIGAESNALAMQAVGRDALLFVEDKPDEDIFRALLRRLQYPGLVDRCRIVRLKGHGDAKYLGGVRRVLETVGASHLRVACLLDPDYRHRQLVTQSRTEDDILFVSLPCKELENLLILQPEALASALAKVAASRAVDSDAVPPQPSTLEIAEKIDELTLDPGIRMTLHAHWLASWLSENIDRSAGRIAEAEEEFDKCWRDASWRRRACPGKAVLAKLRRWLQEEYKLSLSQLRSVFDHYSPSPELLEAFKSLDQHLSHHCRQTPAIH